MEKQEKTVALFGNSGKTDTRQEVQHLLEILPEMGVRLVLSNELRQELNLRDYASFEDTEEPIDLALSVGGDGTFLTTASYVAKRDIPILGINYGHLGFLADVRPKDVERAIRSFISGRYHTEEHRELKVSSSDGAHLAIHHALNEVSVLKQGLSSMISIETTIDGAPLHTYEADGLIVATPTGSTAYNMSVGGPLMIPGVRGTILSPIAEHSLNVRPLVVPEQSVIGLRVSSRNGNYLVSIDGRSQALQTGIELTIEPSEQTVKIVRVGKNSFINSLKDKLAWG